MARARNRRKVDRCYRLWNRRHTTKFNGVTTSSSAAPKRSIPPKASSRSRTSIEYYMGNAKIIREACRTAGSNVYGGVNAPYIWLQTPPATDELAVLRPAAQASAHVVGTPGSGFGALGEGYFRISAFNSRANVDEESRAGFVSSPYNRRAGLRVCVPNHPSASGG